MQVWAQVVGGGPDVFDPLFATYAAKPFALVTFVSKTSTYFPAKVIQIQPDRVDAEVLLVCYLHIKLSQLSYLAAQINNNIAFLTNETTNAM